VRIIVFFHHPEARSIIMIVNLRTRNAFTSKYIIHIQIIYRAIVYIKYLISICVIRFRNVNYNILSNNYSQLKNHNNNIINITHCYAYATVDLFHNLPAVRQMFKLILLNVSNRERDYSIGLSAQVPRL